MNNKTITFYKGEHEVKAITFGDFFQLMQDEINTYEKLGRKEELMNQPMVVEVFDAEGQIVMGKINDLIGWLEGGNVMSVAYYDDIYCEKSNSVMSDEKIAEGAKSLADDICSQFEDSFY